MKRSIACALGLALVLILLPATLAGADFRGTDLWSNLAPNSGGGLSEEHPLSYYALDYHVSGPSVGFGGVDAGDIPALVAQFLAAVFFMFATFLMRLTISAFDWAFNVDIIGGRHGAIHPVGDATQHLYLSTFEPLLKDAILIFGAWLVYMLGARRYGEAGSGGLRALCLAVVALVIIFNPVATIGRASSLTNDLAGSIASGSTGANGGRTVSDRLFDTFVYQPWAVLEFGGLKRCTSIEKDSDGFPRYVNGESNHSICRNTLTHYAPKFLGAAPGSEDRKHLYEDIRDGDEPFDKSDAPAVDMMQAGGATQRLVFTLILCVGIASGILLLGLISVLALFAQLGLLVLLAATPIMVIAAIFPGTNGIVLSWAKWIGKLLIAKVVYAVMISAALFVSLALMSAGGTGQIGYLFAFGGQAVLFLGLFIKRKALAENLTNRKGYRRAENTTKSFVSGSAAAAIGAVATPVASAGAAAAVGKARMDQISKQRAAPNPDTQKSSPNGQPGTPLTTSSGPSSPGGKMPPDSSSPPASAGREYSPNPPAAAEAPTPEANTSAPVATMQQPGDDPMPTKTFREDYEKAKLEREPVKYGEQRPPKPVDQLEAQRPTVNSGSTAASFADQVKQERAKTPGS